MEKCDLEGQNQNPSSSRCLKSLARFINLSSWQKSKSSILKSIKDPATSHGLPDFVISNETVLGGNSDFEKNRLDLEVKNKLVHFLKVQKMDLTSR